MTNMIPAIRELMAKHLASSTTLAALTAALDARVNEAPLDPTLAQRVEELLLVMGMPKAALEEIKTANPNELRPLLGDLRNNLTFDAKLHHASTRTSAWSFNDPTLLQDVGDFSRQHAHAITRVILPALEGMTDKLAGKDNAQPMFLDIGVGVACTAIQFAENHPAVKIVGIDPFVPSLTLARANVAKAKLEDRITLREQGAESLEDNQAFDLAWMPLPFMKRSVIPRAIERTHHALRPGGWLVLAFMDIESGDPITQATRQLRLATWGGPMFRTSDTEALLQEKGFTNIRSVPCSPGSPARFIAGQRKK